MARPRRTSTGFLGLHARRIIPAPPDRPPAERPSQGCVTSSQGDRYGSVHDIFKLAALAALSASALGVPSATAASDDHTAHVSLSHVIRGDERHEAVGRATLSAIAPLRRTEPDGGSLVRFVGQDMAPCSPQVTVFVGDLATSRSARRQVSTFQSRFRLHAIGSGSGTAGPWRLDEITDTSYGKAATHRRWLGIASFRMAHNRYSQLQLSGTADLNCTDEQFRSGPIVASLTHLLSTARIQARIRSAS